MANTRAIKRRIRSVASTQQITRAMKMVAAARLRRAQERLLRIRPYADSMVALLGRLLPYAIGDEHPLLTVRPAKRVTVVLVTSDKGLCGGFNANLFRRLIHFYEDHREVEKNLITIGRKGQQYFSARKYDISKSYQDIFDELTYHDADVISESLVKLVLEEQADEVYVIYSHFVSAISQRQELVKLLPLDTQRFLPPDTSVLTGKTTEGKNPEWSDEVALPDVIFESSLERLLQLAVQRVLTTELYRYFLESISSEFAARMTAMEAATNNAGDMIDRLTLQLNRARQAAITTELTEIVAGADAIQG